MFTINSYHSSNQPLQKDSEYPLFIFNSDFGQKMLTKEIVMTNVNKNKYRPILHATQFFPLITYLPYTLHTIGVYDCPVRG